MIDWLIELPWNILIIGCLTLGLAPFTPPHLYEKLVMLKNGTLKKPLDWFDMFFHLVPWLLLAAKGVLVAL